MYERAFIPELLTVKVNVNWGCEVYNVDSEKAPNANFKL